MADQKTRLRPATPERDEGLVFARYLDQAAEGFFGFMLGRQAASIIADAFTEPGHSLSFEHVVFAERDGVIVGMSLAYTGEQHREFSDEPLERAAGRAARRMKMARLLLAPLWRILETVPEGDFYLQAIAVDKELRGAGLGSILMDHLEGRARSSGSTRLALDVSAKNEGARRFYKRRGMTVESQWPKRLPIRALKFHRMTKMLG